MSGAEFSRGVDTLCRKAAVLAALEVVGLGVLAAALSALAF